MARDAGMDTPESCAHHLAFLCTDLTDPQLYERALAVHRARRRAIEALLTEAADAGELRAGTDAAALAGTVKAITAGAGLCWAVERRGGSPSGCAGNSTPCSGSTGSPTPTAPGPTSPPIGRRAWRRSTARSATPSDGRW
ncbi:TetR family transcriptional regulator C-terminal domain-containing protein [Streptomyces sp. CH8.1]|uniref:TetR family transcriptional regulator C-terminal domain-containing protein n=1 Tax=Streptomyces sp. CH8.1 TaxID=3439546 RepID=UPI003DA041DB